MIGQLIIKYQKAMVLPIAKQTKCEMMESNIQAINNINQIVDGKIIQHGQIVEVQDSNVVKIVSYPKAKYFAFVRNFFEGSPRLYIPELGKNRTVILNPTVEILSIGQQILVQIDQWRGQHDSTANLVTTGSIDTLKLLEYDLPIDEPNYSQNTRSIDFNDRTDLTHLNCITVDPPDSKDLDDAISFEMNQEYIELGVHIASVAEYVDINSEIDLEARERANSIYLKSPDHMMVMTVIPMLPRFLCNELCSLTKGTPKATISVFIRFDHQGNRISTRIVPKSTILVKHQLTYDEAYNNIHFNNWLQHYKLVRNNRDSDNKKYRGETKYPEFQNDSHEAIEEAMIQANIVVAESINRKILRTHGNPISEKMNEFNSCVARLSHVNNEYKNHYLEAILIKAQDRAKYESNPSKTDHYGLSLQHYTHFTSPIRRYADLIVHHIILEHDISDLNLDQICLNCSNKEKLTEKVENETMSLTSPPAIGKHRGIIVSANKCFIGLYVPNLPVHYSKFSVHISKLLPQVIYNESFSESGEQNGFESTDQSFIIGDIVEIELIGIHHIYKTPTWGFIRMIH